MIFFIVAMANLEDNLNKITLVATGDGRIIVGELIIFFSFTTIVFSMCTTSILQMSVVVLFRSLYSHCL